ncbi:MAG: multidrug transporter [Tenacibaculum sp.]
MRNKFFIGLSIIASLLISCGEDDTADIVITDNSSTTINNNSGGGSTDNTVLLSGIQANDLILESDKSYIINGAVVMQEGTKIVIPAGMTIKANKGTNVYLAISQGAQIIAEGTASQPIVFTSNATVPNPGDWGGLIILGKAPINSAKVTEGNFATSEIGALSYGGTDAEDNSGTIKYVRVEYSGSKISSESENNSFSFYGVGNGTTVEFVQAFEGSDDGFEFFGGTVSAKNISAINLEDDSIDWTEGYSGNLSDVYIKQNSNSDKAFECDGYNPSIGNVSNPMFFSKPTISNITIDGLGSGATKPDVALHLREATQGIFENLVITGYSTAFLISGDTADSSTGQTIIDDLLQINNVKFNDVITKLGTKDYSGPTITDTDLFTEDANATGTDYQTWGAGWTKE